MRRLTIWVLLLTLVAGLTAACGDDKKADTSSKDKQTTTKDKAGDSGDDSGDSGDSKDAGDFRTKFIDELASGDTKIISMKEAECAADQLDEDLSDEAKNAFGNDDEADFTDIPEADQKAFLKAFDDCVELETLINSFAAMGGEAEVADCITEKLKDSFDSSGALIEAMITESEDVASIYESCVPSMVDPSSSGSDSGAAGTGVDLKAQLEAAGISTEQAACINSKLQEQYSSAELAQMAADPSALTPAMTSIAEACAVGG